MTPQNQRTQATRRHGRRNRLRTQATRPHNRCVLEGEWGFGNNIRRRPARSGMRIFTKTPLTRSTTGEKGARSPSHTPLEEQLRSQLDPTADPLPPWETVGGCKPSAAHLRRRRQHQYPGIDTGKPWLTSYIHGPGDVRPQHPLYRPCGGPETEPGVSSSAPP